MERKTGARGLRAIMEETMMDLMYKIPSDESITKCTIKGDTVMGDAPALLTCTGNEKERVRSKYKCYKNKKP